MDDIPLREYIDLRVDEAKYAIDMQKQYIDMRFTNMQTAVELRSSSIQTAVDKADLSLNKRLEDMNEFRAQLKDQAGTFVTRTEFDSAKDQQSRIMAQAREYITRTEFATIQRLVYIGMGAVVAVEFLLRFLVK